MGDGAAAAQTVDAAGGDSDADAMDAWGAALEEQAEVEGSNVVPAEPVAFDNLNSSNTGFSGEVNLDMVLDIPVTMAMELGRTQISIRNLLQLNQGSVVELDRMAGEPMDVRVNGTLIARGEVVVVNEKFGIRLTDVISAAERIKNLK
ncbi:MAG: flagellar motor switch protein FliN [Gammaproteobacteria bacterium]|nr:MAG: flagellar motor switch protein FliN [Gammaproteobacteria bacterium]PCH64194.1 MAG: flagellar motor switch protein FliN [Gammaproteobacteria bacterium]